MNKPMRRRQNRTTQEAENNQSAETSTTQRNINKTYDPIIIELPNKLNTNMFDGHEKPEFSINIDYPKFAYGFQPYIKGNKNKMRIIYQV